MMLSIHCLISVCEYCAQQYTFDRLLWFGFNGTFSANRPYRAIKKIKVCSRVWKKTRWSRVDHKMPVTGNLNKTIVKLEYRLLIRAILA